MNQSKAQIRKIVVEKVMGLKPKFSQKDIEVEYDCLVKQNIIA